MAASTTYMQVQETPAVVSEGGRQEVEMTGLAWLNGKCWWEVSRDERYFCAELYHLIREDTGRFIAHVNAAHGAQLDAARTWEVVYEACFYRDLWHLRGRAEALFSPKRTFDLALFEPAAARASRKNNRGSMSGSVLIAAFDDGERFFVGRGGGLRGALLQDDISSGGWRDRRYETKRDAQQVFKPNWFSLEDFVKAVRRAG